MLQPGPALAWLHGMEQGATFGAIGVIYRPDTEHQSHYFQANLPEQFDEFIWFDETRPSQPYEDAPLDSGTDLAGTYPFGL